jgi:hypothetical protein
MWDLRQRILQESRRRMYLTGAVHALFGRPQDAGETPVINVLGEFGQAFFTHETQIARSQSLDAPSDIAPRC